ncbi:MAG: hypothetical protein AAFV53_11915 [Myxococcota bacterium]
MALLIAAIALVTLGAVAAAHPDLRFVDFIGFSERARRIFDGSGELLHPLYPVGYPLLILAGRLVVGDVVVFGKMLSAAAGAGAVFAASRWLSPWAGVWLLGQAALLTWGATEGTDLLAATFVLGAMTVAEKRPGWAGALLGAACMTRYTALTAVPVVMILGRAGLRPLLAMFMLTTAPHWGNALVTWRSPLPDQSENLAIGGHPGGLFSIHSLVRLPGGLRFSFVAATWAWTTRIGVIGIFVGMVRKDPRAFALAAAAVLHMAAVGLAFSNPRLVLPATLFLSLGVFWLMPRWWMLLPAGLLSLGMEIRPALQPDITESSLAAITEKTDGMAGPFVTSSPWFHQRQDGWVVSGVLIRRMGGDTRWATPDELRTWAIAWQIPYAALDVGRVRHSYPGLAPLLGRDLPEGFEKITHAPGWVILRIEP